MRLSDTLSEAVKHHLNLERYEGNEFSKEQLDSVISLTVSKNDINTLDIFPKLISIELESFPSVTNEDLDLLIDKVPNLKLLKIKEQSALIEIDFKKFNKLEELCIIHNENLEHIKNLPKLNKFIFYDNKDFFDNDKIVEFIINNPRCDMSLDILYYIDLYRYLEEHNEIKIEFNNLKWYESVGLRKYLIHEYTKDEVDNLITRISYIASKYIYSTDSDIEKFGVLYRWMLNNVKFLNEDDPKGDKDLIDRVNNIYKVFNFGRGGRLSYAKAFQLLLAYVGVRSSVVYSLGALDTIGYYNGQKIYSLLGTSDYALLRVTLEGKYYYTDISWDSMVNDYQYFDELRLFLVSKEELQLRHKFVGEGNIEETYSYHGDDSDDLIMYSLGRVSETDKVFDDISKFDTNMAAEELNNNFLEEQINEYKQQLSNLKEESLEYQETNKRINELSKEIELSKDSYHKYSNLKIAIIEGYIDYFMSHYISKEDILLSNEELINKLNRKLDYHLLSKYVYGILVQCIKLRTVN